MSASKQKTRKQQEDQARQAALVAFKPILEQLKDPFSDTPYRIQMLADEKAVNEKALGSNIVYVGEKLEEKGYPCKVFNGNGKASVLFYINAGTFSEIIGILEKEVAKILRKDVASAVDALRTTFADLKKFKSNNPEEYKTAILKIKDFCEEIGIIKSIYVEVLDKMYPPKLQEKYKAKFSDLQAEAEQLISKLDSNIAQAEEQEKKAAAEAKAAEAARKKQSHETLGQILRQEVSGYRFQILGSSELALPNNQEKKTVYVEVNPPKDSQIINSYRCKIVDKFGKTHCIFSVDASSKEHAQLQIIVEREKAVNLLKAEFKQIQADFFDAKKIELANEHIQQFELCIEQLELYMEKIKSADFKVKAELNDTQKEAEALLHAMYTAQEIVTEFQTVLAHCKIESEITTHQDLFSSGKVLKIKNEKVKGRVQTILGELTAEAVDKEPIVIAIQKTRKAWEEQGKAAQHLAFCKSSFDSLLDRFNDPHANKDELFDDLSAYVTARVREIYLAAETGNKVYGAIQTELSDLRQKAEKLKEAELNKKRTLAGYVFKPMLEGNPKLLEKEIYISIKEGCVFCQGLDLQGNPYETKILLSDSQLSLNDRLSVPDFQYEILTRLVEQGWVLYSIQERYKFAVDKLCKVLNQANDFVERNESNIIHFNQQLERIGIFYKVEEGQKKGNYQLRLDEAKNVIEYRRYLCDEASLVEAVLDRKEEVKRKIKLSNLHAKQFEFDDSAFKCLSNIPTDVQMAVDEIKRFHPDNLKGEVISVIDEDQKKAEAILSKQEHVSFEGTKYFIKKYEEESAKLKLMEMEFEGGGGVAKLDEMKEQLQAVDKKIEKIDEEKRSLLEEVKQKEEVLKTKEAALTSIDENIKKHSINIDEVNGQEYLLTDRLKRLQKIKLDIKNSISEFVDRNSPPSFFDRILGLSANQLLVKSLNEIKADIDNDPKMTLTEIQHRFNLAIVAYILRTSENKLVTKRLNEIKADIGNGSKMTSAEIQNRYNSAIIEELNKGKADFLFGKSKAEKDFYERFTEEYTNFFNLEIDFEDFFEDVQVRKNPLVNEQSRLRMEFKRLQKEISDTSKEITQQEKKIADTEPRNKASLKQNSLDRNIAELDVKYTDVVAQRKVVESARNALMERRTQIEVDQLIPVATQNLKRRSLVQKSSPEVSGNDVSKNSFFDAKLVRSSSTNSESSISFNLPSSLARRNSEESLLEAKAYMYRNSGSEADSGTESETEDVSYSPPAKGKPRRALSQNVDSGTESETENVPYSPTTEVNPHRIFFSAPNVSVKPGLQRNELKKSLNVQSASSLSTSSVKPVLDIDSSALSEAKSNDKRPKSNSLMSLFWSTVSYVTENIPDALGEGVPSTLQDASDGIDMPSTLQRGIKNQS